MPCCAALNCSNSDKKGFLMKRFPRDPIRRNEWHYRMKRGHWKPTDYSCLCEIHFAPEMWENPRVDGKRILKCNAVPTIFSFTQPKSQGEPPFHGKSLSSKKPDLSHAFVAEPSTLSEHLPEPSPSEVDLGVHFLASQESSTSKCSSSEDEDDEVTDFPHALPDLAKLQAELNRYKKLYMREKRKAAHYKKLLGIKQETD